MKNIINEAATSIGIWEVGEPPTLDDPNWTIAFDTATSNSSRQNIIRAWWWCYDHANATQSTTEEYKVNRQLIKKIYPWLAKISGEENEVLAQEKRIINKSYGLRCFALDLDSYQKKDPLAQLLKKLITGEDTKKLKALEELRAIISTLDRVPRFWDRVLADVLESLLLLPQASVQHQTAASCIMFSLGLLSVDAPTNGTKENKELHYLGKLLVNFDAELENRENLLETFMQLPFEVAVYVTNEIIEISENQKTHRPEAGENNDLLFSTWLLPHTENSWEIAQELLPQIKNQLISAQALGLSVKEALQQVNIATITTLIETSPITFV